jgi:hypothetical protein
MLGGAFRLKDARCCFCLKGAAERRATAAVSADSDPVVAPAAAVAPNVSSDDGLGALVIVLISVGGAMALAGVAYAARRVMRHGHAAA